MSACFSRDFGAGYGLNAQTAGHLSKLHRPAQVVVVGEGQGWVSKLDSPRHHLVDGGCSFLEGVVAVAVKFNVGHF